MARKKVNPPTKTQRAREGFADAEKAWKLFTSNLKHPRNEADLVAEAKDAWPSKWRYAGTAKQTRYMSDKWAKRGAWERYYHDHKGGVNVWLAADVARRESLMSPSAKGTPKPPRERPPAVGWLAQAIDVTIELPDGSTAKLLPDPGAVLACSPDLKTLYIIEDLEGDNARVVAMLHGGTMRVEDRGIVD
jgi:hypothetical protein